MDAEECRRGEVARVAGAYLVNARPVQPLNGRVVRASD
jgi:carbonic anhydrase